MKIKGLMLVLVIAAAALALGGCRKKEPAASPEAPSMETMHEHAEEAKGTVEAAAGEQTMCPIMDGNKIDKNVFVEYKGKKVYFCCPECKGKFEADPEKYISKLPQFNEEHVH